MRSNGTSLWRPSGRRAEQRVRQRGSFGFICALHSRFFQPRNAQPFCTLATMRREPPKQTRQPSHDTGDRPQRVTPWARTIHGAAMPTRSTKRERQSQAKWPPVPDMFDVISYFLDRGDSYTVTASIRFWTKEHPGKALTARALKLRYEAELDRRTAVRTTICKTCIT